jgi:hypothetical protein
MKEKLRIILAGVVDMSVKKSISDNGLDRLTEYLGTISKPQAIEMTLKSHLLLLPLNQAANIKGRMPGKFYEYLRAGRNILALGPPDSDVGKILSETSQGKCYNYEDLSEIKDYIKHCIENYLNNSSSKLEGNAEDFSVEQQTKRLAVLLNEVVE